MRQFDARTENHLRWLGRTPTGFHLARFLRESDIKVEWMSELDTPAISDIGVIQIRTDLFDPRTVEPLLEMVAAGQQDWRTHTDLLERLASSQAIIAHEIWHHLVGDVMVDTLAHARARHGEGVDRVRNLGVEPGSYVLATFHRPANVDQPETLGEVVTALGALDRPVVLPLHPRTRERLERFDLLDALERNDRITLITPVGYLTMLALLLNADLVITDSGGLQKEAYLVGVPCITLREETEWVEAVEAGWNQLVGADPAAIRAAVSSPRPEGRAGALFGDGKASQRIVRILTGGE